MPGTYYLQTGSVTEFSLWLGAVIGMLVTAILVVNNIRDKDADIISGKNTLAVRFGKTYSKIQFILLVMLPFLLPFHLWRQWNKMSFLLTLFTLPIAVHLIIQLFNNTGADLNKVLAGTARFLFIFTLLLSAGLII